MPFFFPATLTPSNSYDLPHPAGDGGGAGFLIQAFFADRGFEVLRHLPAVARRLEKEVTRRWSRTSAVSALSCVRVLSLFLPCDKGVQRYYVRAFLSKPVRRGFGGGGGGILQSFSSNRARMGSGLWLDLPKKRRTRSSLSLLENTKEFV